MRDIKSMKFLLKIRIIQTIDSIYLVQDIYNDKLIKNYKIDINLKASLISLSIEDIKSFQEDVNFNCMHEYCKRMRSCQMNESETIQKNRRTLFQDVNRMH
jgi:hypothetical protein